MIIKSPTYRSSILIAIVFLLFIMGCSKGNSVLPDEVSDQNLPAVSDAGQSCRGTAPDLLQDKHWVGAFLERPDIFLTT
jgi:hypothetical protein